MRENQRFIFLLFCSYTLPVAVLVFLYAKNLPLSVQWPNFLVGLALAVTGTLFLFFRLEKKAIPVPVLESAPTPPSRDEQLEKTVEELKEKWHQKKTECESLQSTLQELQEEYDHHRYQSEEHLQKKDALLAEYAQTVNDLRSNMGNKQQQIEKLQESINDLNYDLDTLINLSKDEEKKEEPPKEVEKSPKPERSFRSKVQGYEEAQVQLKKCINMAQKMNPNQFGSSRYLLDNTALDKRRLFDMFRSETSCMVLLYSLKEKRLIFVNDVCKTTTGWPPEKFVQEFPSLLMKGKQEWENALSALTYQSESRCQLVIESNEGEEILFQSLLGMVPRGVFKNNVVAILYEVAD